MSTFSYPTVERNESIVDKIFGKDVPDPYRHLEDPNDQKTQEFVKGQNQVTEPYLNLCPHRNDVKKILTENQDYRKTGCTFKRGQKYYFFVHEHLKPQPILYQQDSVDGEPRIFFDPNKLSDDGTVALSHSSFSHDGMYFAYGLSHSGSDWIEISIKDLKTGKDLPDKLKRAKFTSIQWTHDNKGFFYAQYPSSKSEVKGTDTEKLQNQCVYYHRLNTDQSQDVLKVSMPERPKWLIDFEVSQDGKYLHVMPREACQDNEWFYADLADLDSPEKFSLKPIYDKLEAEFEYISNNGDTVYFRTNLDAKNYRVVKLDLKNPSKDKWVDVIPNHPENVLLWAELYTVAQQDYLLVNFLRKVGYHLELYKLEGELVREFKETHATISKSPGRRNDAEIFYHVTSFLSPGKTFQFDLRNMEAETRMLREDVTGKFNPDLYKMEKKFYRSKDGTEVHMFIVHRKDLVLDGQNPCILYGYGGFNHCVTSAFNINRVTWLKHFKGVFAVANIRGGGELGQGWHDGGRLLNKQNGFNDFVAAAEYLIEANYTNRDRLAIEGGSNGGLLVAAVSNQRPDLFGATICHVGVLDMIRFSSFTIGYAWISDYGDPENETHFNNLIKYSPYHNIPASVDHYPATLLLTADHDDRVVPAHSLKFAAQLQHKLGKALSDTPLLLRVDTKAGHGAGRPVSKVIDEYTDIYSFLYNALKLEKYYTST